jgi:hypothetical protein
MVEVISKSALEVEFDDFDPIRLQIGLDLSFLRQHELHNSAAFS